MATISPEDEKRRQVKKIAMSTTNLNAMATFKAGMLDLEKRINAPGQGGSCVACFGGKQSLHGIGSPSQVQMGGKKILRALSALSCISLKTLSSPSSSARKSSLEAQAVSRKAAAAVEENKGKTDQRILLRIVMWGGPNTLLLLAPFDAPAECVIGMILDSYVYGVGIQECHEFELFCAHCNSPALNPKQPIGSVGSRHFLLCRKGPQISGLSFFNGHSQIAKQAHSSSHLQSSKHSHSGHSHSFHSNPSQSMHSRSLSHVSSSLSHSSLVAQSQHKRSNSWWNPVQCLTVGQH